LLVHKRKLEHIYINTPSNINTPDNVKIIGHNLNTMKFTLAPVNSERIAKQKSNTEQEINTECETRFPPPSIRDIIITNNPTNISVNPSIIHSIVIMFLLSSLISPKSFTTPLVAKRWALPQTIVKIAPTIIRIMFTIKLVPHFSIIYILLI